MYDRDNDIERLLREDARDKKKTGSGVFSRASRRGYTGTVRTQVDYLKGKEKKIYMGNGEIKVSNIYDDLNNIPSVEDIRKMDKETGKNIIVQARARHSMKELVGHWGFSDNYLYTKFFREFDIVTRDYSARKSRVKMNIDKTVALPNPTTLTNDISIRYVEPAVPVVQPIQDELFELRYVTSESKGKEIQDRISDYLSVLEGDKLYEIKFTIREKK